MIVTGNNGVSERIEKPRACPSSRGRPFLLPVAIKENSREVVEIQAALSIDKPLQGLFFIDFFCSYVNMKNR